MNKAVPVILGIAAVGGLIFALTRKAAAVDSCRNLQASREYFFTYIGLPLVDPVTGIPLPGMPAPQTFKQALGECYDVIYTIDVWDSDLGEYWPPVDPMNDIIQLNSRCRVVVQAPCRLCGFIPQ